MESRSLRARSCSVIFGLSLLAAGCGGGEAAGPSVTVARTSTPPSTIATTTTTTEPTTTEEETTTTEVPTTLEFADDSSGDSATGTTGGSGSGKGVSRSNGNTSNGENEGQFEGDQPTEDITNPTTTTTTILTTTEATTDPNGETTSTIATTTTIDPFAAFVGLDQFALPYTDAASAMKIEFVNLQCNANGATPQVTLTSPSNLDGAEQRVSFFGPSGAAYIAADSVVGGQVQTFGNWLTAPVVADSFDWVSICSQPSWKVLVEFADTNGGFFSGVVDATISG